ncbi:MAG: thioredoxin [Oscillospiraceae bacterium]|nr:thioredoxin [Oscillospiraceae bacterium]
MKVLKAVILVFGAGMMILGIVLGEPVEILRKATKVCLECIGIG